MGLPQPPQRGGYKMSHSIGLLVSGVAKNISRSNFGGDKTRFAQTVSPLIEILSPFLTHRHNAGSNRPADTRFSN